MELRVGVPVAPEEKSRPASMPVMREWFFERLHVSPNARFVETCVGEIAVR
jgi:hypothetical protein